jgi:sigma-B regulation protein RsbU (phosphoserine phosphatase)
MISADPAVGCMTAGRERPAVSLYVSAFMLVAAACFVWATYRGEPSLSWALLAFALLATLADLREVRLPKVGVVGMSFVPAMAALIVLGLWAAVVVAAVSGATSAGFTRDPVKIAFNVSNYVVSTFVAGLVYLSLVPAHTEFSGLIIPAFIATAVDFFFNTAALASVVALSSGVRPLGVWRQNYQWALPGYLTGATFALFSAWLYSHLGVAGLVLALPPVVLIYYSYEIYVGRARERLRFDAERDSFQAELTTSTRLHDELREAQAKVAAEIERARSIQADLLPTESPVVPGVELVHRVEFLDEMGGDYYDHIMFKDGRFGIACGDVMGKGLAAALIMAMARSLLQSASIAGGGPGEILSRVNDGLVRDLEGQRLPYFLTLALAIYDPTRRTVTIAGGGHNPVLFSHADGLERLPSRGTVLGVRPGLCFPEDVVRPSTGDSLAMYTDGLTEARDSVGSLYGLERLEESLMRRRAAGAEQTVTGIWSDVERFRAGAPATDDATLLLVRFS